MAQSTVRGPASGAGGARPHGAGGARAGTALPPRTPYEDAVGDILGDVFDRRDIDVHDGLLTLGDVSRIPHALARIRRTLGIDVAMADYVESHTVAGLAANVAARSFATRAAARPRALRPRAADAAPVLSYDQQRLWLENQLLPGQVYNVHGRRRLVGRLDVGTLQASIRAILARHETLRTRFPSVDGDPVQLVDDPDDDWTILVEDLAGSGDTDRERLRAARALLDEESAVPFDLDTGPLIRCRLLRLTDTDHVLGVTMHHIVSDAWSIGLFVRELTALYEAGGDPEGAGLAPLPVQYRDYSVWQRDWLAAEVLEEQLRHWRDHLLHVPRALALPTPQRRSHAKQAAADRIVAELGRDETVALHELCRAHGVTSFMVLYAVLAVVFGRWSAQTDIVVGVPVSGRTDSATDRLIGFFVNVLPLRIDLSDDPTFVDLFARVRDVALDGYAHAEAPIDVLVQDLDIDRDPRRTPLFEVVLNVVGTPEAEEVTGLTVQPMHTPSLFSRFDVSVTAQEVGGVLRLKVDFSTDRCDADLGQALLGQVRTLLRAATRDPQVRPLRVPLGDPGDGQGPGAETVPAPTPHRAVARRAVVDGTALVDGTGSYSYRWLDLAVERVAEVVAGRPSAGAVGVVRRPTAGFVAALVGCARAGRPATVIETDDPALTGPLGLDCVVDVAPQGEPAAGTLDLRSSLPAPGESGTWSVGDRPMEPVADWAAERFGARADDRVAVLTGLPGHLVSAAGTAFAGGGALVIPERPFGDDAGALVDWLSDRAISVAHLDVSVLRVVTTGTPGRPVPRLPDLRCVVVDNDGTLLPHDVAAIRRVAPGCRVVAVYRVGDDGRPLAVYEAPADLDVRTAPLRVPLGHPVPGSRAWLCTPRAAPAGVGEVAEVRVGDRHTGDRARCWPDGRWEYVGPAGADPTFDLLETVATLRDATDVRDVLVTETVGADGDTELAAYVVGPDSDAGTVGLHNHMVARLPGYLVPEHVVPLDALPRTAWGGYDLRALPRPDGAADAGDEYVAGRTSMERQLTGILEQLLGMERVGVYDSFFELGGFSMLATQLVARVREGFGVSLAVRDVFESPTVDELAQLIVRAQAEAADVDDIDTLLSEIEATDPEPATPAGSVTTGSPAGPYRRAVDRLRRDAVFGADKPDETAESTAAALCHAAVGVPCSARLAAERSVPTGLTERQSDALDALLERRVAGEPLAYLTGRGSFLGLEFRTAPGALVPRADTEILGAGVLDLVRDLAAGRLPRAAAGDAPVRVLDLGTGTGNLAVSLAVLEPRARVWAGDIEADAVAVAADNVEFHDVADRVTLGRGDLFAALDGVEPPEPFDVAVCNPPYLPSDRAHTLPPEVGAYEPLAAFDGGQVGLSVMYRFLTEAPRHVRPGGWVCLELGAGMGRVVQRRMTALGTYGRIRTLTDDEGVVRAVLARTRP